MTAARAPLPTYINCAGYRLTFRELEALAGLGLTGFLALDSARVAGHEAVLAQYALVLGVDLHQCAGDSQTQGLGLAGVAAAVEVDVDVILLGDAKGGEGLLYDVLKNRIGEVNVQGALVDSDVAVAFLDDDAGYGGLAAAYCINCFHVFRLFQFVDVNNFGVLSLVVVLGTVVDVHVLDETASQTVLGQHTLHNVNVQGVHAFFDVLVERLGEEALGSGLTLAAGIAGVAEVNLVGHLFAGEDGLLGVDDDNLVAALHIGAVAGFVLSAQDFGNLCAKATKNLVGSVNNHPLLLLGIGADC